MLAIARFSTPLAEASHFEAQLSVALDAFSACAGFVSGEFGQNLDDHKFVVPGDPLGKCGFISQSIKQSQCKDECDPITGTSNR